LFVLAAKVQRISESLCFFGFFFVLLQRNFSPDFVVLLLPRRLLSVYQIVAGGNNKLFGDNKTVISAKTPQTGEILWQKTCKSAIFFVSLQRKKNEDNINNYGK
jgi:hypothetical protein